MIKTILYSILLVAFCAHRPETHTTSQPLRTVKTGGLLGERIDLWRNRRLWYVERSDFLLSGFEQRPGTHTWQGEHVGKWLHAATLAYNGNKDPALRNALDSTVQRLLASQLENGYMGTYTEKERFDHSPADTLGWDIWTHRYNLYGLLVYERSFPDEKIVAACKKMADLLIDVYREDKADITHYGTRKGISSTTLLESIVMLYERTKEQRYLNFAERIVQSSEENPGLHLMGDMLDGKSVVHPGDGKAYQLMANLLGYLRLYKATSKEQYLQTVKNAWEQIRLQHVLVTGGPWTRKTDYNGNRECFAHTSAFQPTEIVVENCCTVTWIQLNLQLAEMTGEAKYAEETEKAMFNHFFGGQHTGGIDWCYYTKPNQAAPPYVPKIHCCASSGPRALEMFAASMAEQAGDHVIIHCLSPATIALEEGSMQIRGDFPFSGNTSVVFDLPGPRELTLELRVPDGASLQGISLNGQRLQAKQNTRGYYEVRRRWKKGETLAINMQYKLQAHVQEGEQGKKWIAFSWGPLALAQKVSSLPVAEPFRNQEGSANAAVAMLTPLRSEGRNIVFSIKNSGIELIPYYQAGSHTSGPRTYFEYQTTTP